MTESRPQVDSDLAPPTNPINNGKRGAVEVVEPQVVGNKKHKKLEENIRCSSPEPNEEVSMEAAYLSLGIQLAATTQDAKKASSSNESMQEDGDDNISKEYAKHLEAPKKSVEVPPAIKPITTTQDDAERASISNEYKEEVKDDYSEDDHQHLETLNRSALKQKSELLLDHPTRLDLARKRTEHHSTRDTGSKTLFLGNLSFLIEEDDVRDFFKNVGEIADIRFAIKDDRFLGYGHIEFTTAEAAQEALKLNKEVLLDRRVALDISRRQRGAYTPGNSMDKSNQRGGHAQVKTVYVRGFESMDEFDNIRSALEKHFGKCGEISRLYIPKDHVSGSPRGVAFIEFTDSHGFRQALGLDGSEVGGSRLTVEEAKKQRGDGREGSGYVGGGWSGSAGSYVSESGSGGWWNGSAGSYGRESGSVGCRSGSSVTHVSHSRESGSGGGRSGSAASYVRESGSGGGWCGSGVGRSGSGGGRSGYGGGQSGYDGGWSGCGGSYVRESGSGGGWSGSHGRESGSCGGGGGKTGYGSRLRMQSGYDGISQTGTGSGGGWRRESGYGGGGGGWGRGSGSTYGRFSSSGGGRGSSHRVGSFLSGSRRDGRP